MSRILVVDDNRAMREQYAYDLHRLGGYAVLTAADGDAALRLLEEEPVDAVVLDLEMPGRDGFAVLRALRERGDRRPVIVYTGTGDYSRCVRAVKLGAWSFIDKSEPLERVAREIENALESARLREEVAGLRRRLDADSPLLGESDAMQALRDGIARLAPIPSPVLVRGESGTGKELVARELHRQGPGADAPFVALNCAALPRDLLESELFGHERGAFTGADRLHRGAFERAGGGTLFLDEVGELPAAAQAKLLRVLEQRELTRVGGDRTVPVTARVVAATHRDLDALAAQGDFREDLLFRLNVHVLTVPPLRERPGDVPLLARHFLAATAARFGRAVPAVTDDALARLASRPWRRNNVRELRNAVERLLMACDDDTITAALVDRVLGEPALAGAAVADDPSRLRLELPAGGTLQELRQEAERRIVQAALERHDWHLTRTARALGLADHASLSKVMKRLGIRRSA